MTKHGFALYQAFMREMTKTKNKNQNAYALKDAFRKALATFPQDVQDKANQLESISDYYVHEEDFIRATAKVFETL